MTLAKSTGRKLKLLCDEPGCKAQYGEPFYASEIKSAVASARMHGWHVLKTKAGNWRHYCPKHDDDNGGGKRKPKPRPAAPAMPPGRQWWND